MPWANRRLATASGYGAGVSSPGWYDHLFAHPPDQVVITWFGRAAELLRRADHPVSPDHVIASVALSRRLAELRDRPVAGLAEVLDAAAAVLSDGSTDAAAAGRRRAGRRRRPRHRPRVDPDGAARP